MFNNKEYLAKIQEIVEEHNKLRKDPKSFIPALQDRIHRLDKKNMIVISPGVKIQTVEGRLVINEAIEFLETVTPLKDDLMISKALCKSAQQHAEDLGKNGLVGHVGSLGETLEDRFDSYIDSSSSIGENITFSIEKTGRDYLIDLLIDDGVENRIHRHTLFNSDFALLGVGIADHTVYGKCVVIDYGSDIIPVREADGLLRIDTDYHLETVEHYDGFNSFIKKYFQKRILRAYAMPGQTDISSTTEVVASKL